MQLPDIAAVALPQFCRALQDGLAAAARANPRLRQIPVMNIGISVTSDEDGAHYLCSAEVVGESPCMSYLHLPEIHEPERAYERFLSDVKDWIVETRFGWGLKLE